MTTDIRIGREFEGEMISGRADVEALILDYRICDTASAYQIVVDVFTVIVDLSPGVSVASFTTSVELASAAV